MEKSTICDLIITVENLDRIEIILCDTQDGANIGSACRAMKTMGISHLTLVTDRTYDENRVKTLALHAFDLYENRKEFRTLDEAISDSILSVAATRRRGKDRKTSAFTPEELAKQINMSGEGKISIVFGCEANGLSDEQVHLCSSVVTIPTSDAFPSLNLAQAVQIICYCLYTNLKQYPSGGNIITTQRVMKTVDKCIQSLDDIGYFKVDDERVFTREFLKDQFSRSSMTEGEIQRMEKIFTKASTIARYKNQEADNV